MTVLYSSRLPKLLEYKMEHRKTSVVTMSPSCVLFRARWWTTTSINQSVVSYCGRVWRGNVPVRVQVALLICRLWWQWIQTVKHYDQTDVVYKQRTLTVIVRRQPMSARAGAPLRLVTIVPISSSAPATQCPTTLDKITTIMIICIMCDLLLISMNFKNWHDHVYKYLKQQASENRNQNNDQEELMKSINISLGIALIFDKLNIS